MDHLIKIKSLLGVTDDKDAIIEFTLEKTKDIIKNHCNIKEIPSELDTIMISMAIDIYRAENYGSEESATTVKSISEGDISVSFGTESNDSYNKFIKNYEKQLNRYRRLRW